MLEKYCKQFDAAFRIREGKNPKIAKRDAGETLGLHDEGAADARQEHNIRRLAELQKLLYADGRFALLIVLQGMDTSGKDGTIRHLLTGVNPQGVRVKGFKQPTAEEMAHDFLWRIHAACPQRGEIGVFNRSHYEGVLIERVHKYADERTIENRYRQFNNFERMLTENGTVILKFYLHISKAEQAERLQERIDDPEKHWKMSPNDLNERKLWPKYMAAYQDAVARCSTDDAPWYVIPSNHKWFRNLAISEIVVDRLEKLKLRYPKPTFDPTTLKVV